MNSLSTKPTDKHAFQVINMKVDAIEERDYHLNGFC